MLKAPSLQTYYDYSPFDSVFTQLRDNAPEDERKKYFALVRQCRERQDWTELLAPNKSIGEASRFEFRVLPGTVYRAIIDMLARRVIGPATYVALMFRAAVVSIDNFEGELAFASHDGVPGKIATSAIVDRLDAFDPQVVAELADGVVSRAQAIAPRP